MFKLLLFLLSMFFAFAANASEITTNKQNTPGSSSSFITYNSKNEPKARGLNFNIEYPADWDSKAGKHEHIVRLFAQIKFDGTILKMASVTVYVNKLPDDEIPDPNDDSFFTAENAQSILPNNAVLLTFRKTKLEGCNAMLIEYRQQAERLGGKLFMKGLMCALIYRNYYINIQTAASANLQSPSEEYFNECKPTFMRIINSFVILKEATLQDSKLEKDAEDQSFGDRSYDNDQEVPENETEVKQLRKAAEKGDVEAASVLASA